MTAERDGSESHGLFRLPGYVASLNSGKVDGKAEPVIENKTSVLISCDAQNGFASFALEKSLPVLINAAKSQGIALLGLKRSAHFAALWPEVEKLSEAGLIGLACTTYKPTVAPYGTRKALFGTNPLAFSWPRPGKPPVVFDMATSARALGDIQIAARDGHELPSGVGLDAEGNPMSDPTEILKGVVLPFGGYKGSAISMMIELLSGALVGSYSSVRTAEVDNNDGGPPPRGELIIAISPQLFAPETWSEEAENLFRHLEAMPGYRMPGARRHRNRNDSGSRAISSQLLKDIRALATS